MDIMFSYIKQKEKVFVIIAVALEFMLYLLTGIFFINGHFDFTNSKFPGIVFLICSVFFPARMLINVFHIKNKIFDYLWIVKIALALLLLVSAFTVDVYCTDDGYIIGKDEFEYFVTLSIVFFVFSCVDAVCIDHKKIGNPVVAVPVHSASLAAIAVFLTYVMHTVLIFREIYFVCIYLLIGTMVIVFHAFVYAGVSRWVCPDCQKFNKSKAKFCVGCGKVRPEHPKPVKKPRPAPVYAAPAPQPAAVTPQPQATAPQPVAVTPQPQPAAPRPEGTGFCSECGAQLLPGAVFCGQCGKPVN